MTRTPCLLRTPSRNRIVDHNYPAAVIIDTIPVFLEHTLIISGHHFVSFFELNKDGHQTDIEDPSDEVRWLMSDKVTCMTGRTA